MGNDQKKIDSLTEKRKQKASKRSAFLAKQPRLTDEESRAQFVRLNPDHPPLTGEEKPSTTE